LTPREEIKNETDPLWSIEIKQWNLGVYKDFDEKIMFEENLFVKIKTSTIYAKHWGFTQ
jgi:hypothetical protein